MEVRSDRRYEFTLSRDDLWTAISDVEDFRRWWPWLRRLDAVGLVAGDRWTCVVQPPMPYTLRFLITIEEVVDRRSVTAAVSGDIVGTARLELEDRDGEAGCSARLESALAPGNGVLRAVARVAQPLVRFGHDWVLDTGARQFARRVG